jgi:hypothetical protein
VRIVTDGGPDGPIVHDCAATTDRGWRALAGFLHGYNSVHREVRWRGEWVDPFATRCSKTA